MRQTAIVTEIEPLAPSVIQITVSFSVDFQFKPGQWVNFRFPEGVSRAYTIASAPERPQAVQLCVRVGAGPGGEALRKLEAGAQVQVDGPYGDFVLPEDDSRGVVFLAGDVGIAPVRSIVLHLLAVGDRRRIVVLYEPDQRHILYAGDFDPLARAGDIVHESGPIEGLVERNRGAIKESIVMAAGFDPFLDRVKSALEAIDADPGSAITETFGPQP
ncbi:MAG TPA: FAD-dependent oxidoreductase [Thermoanaerobaculia bacterium]|jgi:ferredoxin-NADP reductase|nr:FAD-dependent oxidoreductase [Thermoanaerobaculia bacterium]